MTAFVALLRVINVGGAGKLPMSDLKAMCEDAGFGQVRTYIASGNVVFTAKITEKKVKAVLEERLAAYVGNPARDALSSVTGRQDEELKAGAREIYVHYSSGQGRSKLKIPAAQAGTARNMNTVAALAKLAAAL